MLLQNAISMLPNWLWIFVYILPMCWNYYTLIKHFAHSALPKTIKNWLGIVIKWFLLTFW